jgi:hypothetical protein
MFLEADMTLETHSSQDNGMFKLKILPLLRKVIIKMKNKIEEFKCPYLSYNHNHKRTI